MTRKQYLAKAGKLVDQALALDIQSYSEQDAVRSRAMRVRAGELRAMARLARMDGLNAKE